MNRAVPVLLVLFMSLMVGFGDFSQSPVAPRTAGGQANLAQYLKLKQQLLADEISQGHAFNKHVLGEGQFSWVKNRAQFAQHADDVMSNPSAMRYYKDGRTVFLQESSSSVLIKNPVSGESTMFQASDWSSYLQKLPSRSTPYQ